MTAQVSELLSVHIITWMPSSVLQWTSQFGEQEWLSLLDTLNTWVNLTDDILQIVFPPTPWSGMLSKGPSAKLLVRNIPEADFLLPEIHSISGGDMGIFYLSLAYCRITKKTFLCRHCLVGWLATWGRHFFLPCKFFLKEELKFRILITDQV